MEMLKSARQRIPVEGREEVIGEVEATERMQERGETQ